MGFNNRTISNCYSIGTVVGNVSIGGLVGLNNRSLSDSYSNGSVSGNEAVGGLVGSNLESISNSFSNGNITGRKFNGGLIGSNHGNIKNSHYNIDNVSINGDYFTTRGGLYKNQYEDWFSNNFKLDITDYITTLIPSSGYYKITSIQGLKDLLGFAEVGGFRFRLGEDINLSGIPGFHIPYFSSEEFDGNYHVISHLEINIPNEFIGLIGYNQGGTIRNTVLENISVIGYCEVGGTCWT